MFVSGRGGLGHLLQGQIHLCLVQLVHCNAFDVSTVILNDEVLRRGNNDPAIDPSSMDGSVISYVGL